MLLLAGVLRCLRKVAAQLLGALAAGLAKQKAQQAGEGGDGEGKEEDEAEEEEEEEGKQGSGVASSDGGSCSDSGSRAQSPEDLAALGEQQARLLSTIGVDLDATGLVFRTSSSSSSSSGGDGGSSGRAAALEPAPATLGLALVLSATRAEELAGHSSVASLLDAAGDSALEGRAKAALRAAAGAVLDEAAGSGRAATAATESSGRVGEEESGFEVAAREFCASRLAVLREFAAADSNCP